MEFFDYIFLSSNFSLLKFSGYIDPGSGSAIIAMILSVLAGAGMTLKIYWHRLKQKLSKKN